MLEKAQVYSTCTAFHARQKPDVTAETCSLWYSHHGNELSVSWRTPALTRPLQVPELLRDVSYKGSTKALTSLKELRGLLAEHHEIIDAVLEVPGAVDTLCGLITSHDSQIQLEAMYVCIHEPEPRRCGVGLMRSKKGEGTPAFPCGQRSGCGCAPPLPVSLQLFARQKRSGG